MSGPFNLRSEVRSTRPVGRSLHERGSLLHGEPSDESVAAGSSAARLHANPWGEQRVGRNHFARVRGILKQQQTTKQETKQMPKMSEINVQKSRWFKVSDLTEATGQPWAKAQLPVEIESAEIGEYPKDENGVTEDAFIIRFVGHEKPLGCNLTNRKVLAGIVGDEAEWDTPSLAGTRLIVYAESTSMGTGIRLRYDNSASQPAPKVGNDPIHDDEPASDEETPF